MMNIESQKLLEAARKSTFIGATDFFPPHTWRKNKVRKLSLEKLRARKAIVQKIDDDIKMSARNIADAIIKIEKEKEVSLIGFIEEIRKYFKEALVKSNPKF